VSEKFAFSWIGRILQLAYPPKAVHPKQLHETDTINMGCGLEIGENIQNIQAIFEKLTG
jgi:hypothetical protein